MCVCLLGTVPESQAAPTLLQPLSLADSHSLAVTRESRDTGILAVCARVCVSRQAPLVLPPLIRCLAVAPFVLQSECSDCHSDPSLSDSRHRHTRVAYVFARQGNLSRFHGNETERCAADAVTLVCFFIRRKTISATRAGVCL